MSNNGVYMVLRSTKEACCAESAEEHFRTKHMLSSGGDRVKKWETILAHESSLVSSLRNIYGWDKLSLGKLAEKLREIYSTLCNPHHDRPDLWVEL